jgi:DNA-binding transcriptional LysR family regulator
MSCWDGIDEFVAVATAGSFIGGARALGVSTSHISRAIQDMEQRLETQLFHRTTRVVRLSDTGRSLLDHCRQLIADREDMLALIHEESEPQGELRLTCSTAMGERFLAPIMRRFAMRHPRLSVTLDLTNRVVDLIVEGYDLAIRTGALTDTRLIGTKIGDRSFLTCAAPAYLDDHALAPTCVEDLDRHDCVAGTSPTWHFKVDGKALLYRPQARFRCNSGLAVVDACLAGMGICQLPEFYVLPHIRSGQLRLVLPDLRPDEEPIWAVYPRRRHLMPKIRAAIDHIRDQMSAEMRCI